MLFHKIEKTSIMTAGASKKELKVNYSAGFLWLAILIILLGLALYAYQTGWSEGSTTILSIAAAFGGFGGGVFFGEREKVKDEGV